MEISKIVDITTLKQYCNYKSNKNWKSFTKSGSILPQLVASTRKNASGSLQVVELLPFKYDYSNSSTTPMYHGSITHLIFSYDSLIGCVSINHNEIFIVNADIVKTTPTTRKILTTLNKRFVKIGRQTIDSIINFYKLYTYTRLQFKGDVRK